MSEGNTKVVEIRGARDIDRLDEIGERKKFFQHSLDLFLLMLENEPKNVSAWGHIGLLLYELGRFDEGLDYFRKITDDEPDNSVAHDAMGFINMERGNFREAAASFEKVLSLNPGRFDVAVDLALSLYHIGEYDRAKGLIKGGSDGEIGTKEYFLLGKIAGAKGEEKGWKTPHYEKALKCYSPPEGPVREAVFATLNEMRGIIYLESGKMREAKGAFLEAAERASQTDPDRMILSGTDLTYKVRAKFISGIRELIYRIY